MNLQEIRILALENCGREIPPGIASTRVDRLVNRAVEHVTNIVEGTAKLYNMAPSPIAVSVVSGTEKYLLGASGVIRKILYVDRVPAVGRPQEVRIIPFQHKNQYSGTTSFQDTYRQCGNMGAGTFVYIVRERDGEWYLGFPPETASAMTLNVYYSPPITPLATGINVPTEVPEHHHELIAVRTTIMLLDQHSKSPARWERHYAELRAMLEGDLESWNRTGSRVRQLHVSRR